MEKMWKGEVVVKLRYYPGISLKPGNPLKSCIRVADVLATVQTENILHTIQNSYCWSLLVAFAYLYHDDVYRKVTILP
jgi:hypothetical protein